MKRTFTIRQQRAILRALVRHWWAAFRPCISRALFLQRQYFTDEKIRAAVNALFLHGGDLEAVRSEWKKRPAPWHSKFFQWAESVKGGDL